MDIAGLTKPSSWPQDYKSRVVTDYLKAAAKVAFMPVIGRVNGRGRGHTFKICIDPGKLGQAFVWFGLYIDKYNRENVPKEGSPDDLIEFQFMVPFNAISDKKVRAVDRYKHLAVKDLKSRNQLAGAGFDEHELIDATDAAIEGSENSRTSTMFVEMHVNDCRLVKGDLARLAEIQNDDVGLSLRLLAGDELFDIKFWFRCRNVAHCEDNILKYLRRSFESREPALSQYYDTNYNLVLDLWNTPTINDIGGGMYAIESANVLDSAFRNLPVKTEWDSLDEFRKYQSLTGHGVRPQVSIKGRLPPT